MTNLNLGCGRLTIPGFIGVDARRETAVQVQARVADLPFKDASAEFIFASHVIEHIPDSVLVRNGHGGFRENLGLDRVRDEITRVLKPGGKIIIRVPYKDSGRFDIYHFKQFDEASFLAWEPLAANRPSGLQQGGRLVQERWYVSTIVNAWRFEKHMPRVYRRLLRTFVRREFPHDRRFRLPLNIPWMTRELTVVLKKV